MPILITAGTYREKKPYMWWRLDEEAMPTKRLYKELSSELDQSIDNEKLYNFAFMSEKDLEKDLQKASGTLLVQSW